MGDTELSGAFFAIQLAFMEPAGWVLTDWASAKKMDIEVPNKTQQNRKLKRMQSKVRKYPCFYQALTSISNGIWNLCSTSA